MLDRLEPYAVPLAVALYIALDVLAYVAGRMLFA